MTRKTTAAAKLDSGLMIIPFDEYAKIDAVNKTRLGYLADSPLHCKHAMTHPQKDTASLAIGRAGDCSVLEPARFLDTYIRWDGGRRFGKEWEAFKAANAGREILTQDEWDRCLGLRAAVRGCKDAMRYLGDGIPQASFVWTDQATGLQCKGRADWVSEGNYIVDLKTCRDLGRFHRDTYDYRYHIQAAMYQDGIAAATGKEPLPFIFIAVESDEPYDVAVFHATQNFIDVGRREYARLLDLYQWCEKTNNWPGRYIGEQDLDVPPYSKEAING